MKSYNVFFNWLFSLSIMFQSSWMLWHVSVVHFFYFLIIAHGMICYVLFIHSSVKRNLVVFILWILKIMLLSTSVYMFLHGHVFIFLGHICNSGIVGSCRHKRSNCKSCFLPVILLDFSIFYVIYREECSLRF